MNLNPRYLKRAKDVLIYSMLILFFPFLPLVLFFMWKYVNWSKKTKWITTGILTFLFCVGFSGFMFGPPTVTLQNVKNNQISIESSMYVIKGDVSSFKDILKFEINREPVKIKHDKTFSHEVTLKEGDNKIELVAVNDNGQTTENLTVYRMTQAEIAALQKSEKSAAQKKATSEEEERLTAEKEAASGKTKRLAAEEEKKSRRSEESSSKCNWWCRLTSGDKKNETNQKAEDKKKNVSEKEKKLAAQKKSAEKERERLAAEKKALEEKARAARRVQDLKNCKISLDDWTSDEVTAYRDNYGHCGGFDVISVCEQWFKSRYPYRGSTMHWIVDLRDQGRRADGSKYIVVGVTIQNAFGAKYGATLECAGKYNNGGRISNTLFSVY